MLPTITYNVSQTFANYKCDRRGIMGVAEGGGAGRGPAGVSDVWGGHEREKKEHDGEENE